MIYHLLKEGVKNRNRKENTDEPKTNSTLYAKAYDNGICIGSGESIESICSVWEASVYGMHNFS